MPGCRAWLLLLAFFLLAAPAWAEEQFVELDLVSVEAWESAMATGARPLACRPAAGPGIWLADAPAATELVARGFSPRSVLGSLAEWRLAEERNRRRSRAASDDFFADYADLAEIENRITELVAAAPGRAHLLDLGTSHEGRTILGVELQGTAPGVRPALLLNGTQHAREWIASMVPLFVLGELIAQAEASDDIAELLDAVDVFVVPVVNPDGFVHSHVAGGDRMWRKNRRVFSGTSCVGVDLNRNWGTDWNGGQSTSANRCSDLHVGPSAHSEPETQALKGLVESIPNLVGHIDFHNYSQLILQPWGYTNALPTNFAEIDALGEAMGAAMESVHGRDYPNYSGDGGLYLASGIFPDWTTEVHGALGYTLELRPPSASPGFLLPAVEIRPTAEEAYAGVVEMLRWASGACGDGLLQEWESCDDGNIVAGDGCSPTCASECGELEVNKLVAARLDRVPGSQTLVLKASVDVPAGGFDPLVSSVSLRITDAADVTWLDESLATNAWDSAAGSGWRTNGKRTRWLWRNRTPGGIERLSVRERRGLLQVTVQGKALDLAGITGPLTVHLGPAASAPCETRSFEASECDLLRGASALRCR